MGDLWRRAWKGAIMDGSNMGGQASRHFSRLLGWPTDATDSLLLAAFPTLNLSVFVIFSFKLKLEVLYIPEMLPLVYRNSNTPKCSVPIFDMRSVVPKRLLPFCTYRK